MHNPNQFPTALVSDSDPWKSPASVVEADPWGPQARDLESWGITPDPLEATYNMPAYDGSRERGNEQRETLRQKASRKIGELATKLSGIRMAGRSSQEVFGAGGLVSKGIDGAQSMVGRAEAVANSKSFRVAEHIPGVGKYARAAGDLVGTAAAISKVTENYSYDAGVTNFAGAREQMAANARDASMRVGRDALRGGLSAVGERYGVTTSEDGERKIKKIKLVRNLGRLAINPSRALKDLRVGLDGAASAGRTSAASEMTQARAHVADAFASNW